MKLVKTIFAGMYAALAVLCPDAAAQDTTLFTLKDCMEYAVSNSTDVRIQQATNGDNQIARRDAILAAFTLCRRYLQEFAYRITPGAWIFVLTVLLSLTITALSVLWQIRKAAAANPADALRSE